MQDYVEAFRQAAERTDALAGGMSNYPLKIDSGLNIDLASVVAKIAEVLSEFMSLADVLPGQSFRVVRDLSYALFDLRIRHTVTVGDVELVDGLHIGLTHQKLAWDVSGSNQSDFMNRRFAGKPVKAHAWITLEDGSVIDATILATQHCKSSKPKGVFSVLDAVYYTGKTDTPVVRYIPMLTGFVYHQRVLSASVDGGSQNYSEWYEEYALMMARLDLSRLVPGLTAR